MPGEVVRPAVVQRHRHRHRLVIVIEQRRDGSVHPAAMTVGRRRGQEGVIAAAGRRHRHHSRPGANGYTLCVCPFVLPPPQPPTLLGPRVIFRRQPLLIYRVPNNRSSFSCPVRVFTTSTAAAHQTNTPGGSVRYLRVSASVTSQVNKYRLTYTSCMQPRLYKHIPKCSKLSSYHSISYLGSQTYIKKLGYRRHKRNAPQSIALGQLTY